MKGCYVPISLHMPLPDLSNFIPSLRSVYIEILTISNSYRVLQKPWITRKTELGDCGDILILGKHVEQDLSQSCVSKGS